MDPLPMPKRTSLANRRVQSPDFDRAHRALLGSIDGRRNIVELESVARALGLDASEIERMRQQGLIEFAIEAPYPAAHKRESFLDKSRGS